MSLHLGEPSQRTSWQALRTKAGEFHTQDAVFTEHLESPTASLSELQTFRTGVDQKPLFSEHPPVAPTRRGTSTGTCIRSPISPMVLLIDQRRQALIERERLPIGIGRLVR